MVLPWCMSRCCKILHTCHGSYLVCILWRFWQCCLIASTSFDNPAFQATAQLCQSQSITSTSSNPATQANAAWSCEHVVGSFSKEALCMELCCACSAQSFLLHPARAVFDAGSQATPILLRLEVTPLGCLLTHTSACGE